MSERDDDVGLDPFAEALAAHVGGANPELEDAFEGELDGLLFGDDNDAVAYALSLEDTHRRHFGPRPDNTLSVDPEYDEEARRLREQYAADAEVGLDLFSDPLKD